MANEDMNVMVLASNKGGCGKTMMAKAFGSAALGADYRVHFIDADANENLRRWCDTAREKGYWPDNGKMSILTDADAIEKLIDELYDEGETDLILIDTEGVGSELLQRICLLADTVVTPVKITKDDYETTLRFQKWFEALQERTEGEEIDQVYVVNAMDAPTAEKLSASEQVYYKRIREQYPTVPTALRSSKVFVRMDAEGPLYSIATQTAAETEATKRITLGAANKALHNATVVMNEVILGERYNKEGEE